MKRYLLFPAVLLLAAAMAGCASRRGDPVSSAQNAAAYGGSLTLGTERANTPVSEENKLTVCQILNSEIYGLCLRSLGGVGITPQAADSLMVTRISGAYSGYAQVLGRRKLRGDNKTFDFNFRVTLYDFSDSGSVFMGRELGANGYLAIDGGMFTHAKLYLSDGLAFTGNYSGAVEYNNMKLPINTCNKISSVYAQTELIDFTLEGGSQTLKHGDTYIRFNPYFREDLKADLIPPPCMALGS